MGNSTSGTRNSIANARSRESRRVLHHRDDVIREKREIDAAIKRERQEAADKDERYLATLGRHRRVAADERAIRMRDMNSASDNRAARIRRQVAQETITTNAKRKTSPYWF